MSVSVEVKGADKVLAAAERVERYIRWGMVHAFERALTKYKVKHQREKMKASPPPLWRGRSPVGQGVLGTRQHAGKTGFLSLFRVTVSGDRLSNMEGKLATRGGMIAYRQEFGISWRPGRIPFPPAKDARGRTTAKAKRLWDQGKLIRILIRGKEFWFARNPAYKRNMRAYRKQRKAGGSGTKPDKRGRLIPMFHISAHKLPARLSFYRLWKGFIPQAKKMFIDVLRAAVARSGRGAA